jgi:hypothetical protein
MLEERYPPRGFDKDITDESVTRAVWRGGVEVHINFLDAQNHSEAIPSRL